MLLQVMQSCKANTQNTCNGEKIKFFWNKIHLPFLFTYTRNFTLVNKINVMKKLLLPFLFILLFTSCKKTNTNPPTPPVSIPSVTICTQVWMLKNLDVSTYRNGDLIPKVTTTTAWDALTTGAWRWCNNDPAMGVIYGKLYNWYVVNDPRGLAPTGWHVPSDAEWTTLSTCLGGYAVAGGAMKETGTTHWTSPNTGATNSSGFTGLPGGGRN